jgi:hypothetical protein
MERTDPSNRRNHGLNLATPAAAPLPALPTPMNPTLAKTSSLVAPQAARRSKAALPLLLLMRRRVEVHRHILLLCEAVEHAFE